MLENDADTVSTNHIKREHRRRDLPVAVTRVDPSRSRPEEAEWTDAAVTAIALVDAAVPAPHWWAAWALEVAKNSQD